jgi:predicted PurR-regulated permease PerM
LILDPTGLEQPGTAESSGRFSSARLADRSPVIPLTVKRPSMPRTVFTGTLAALLVAGFVWVAWQLAYILLLAVGGLLFAVLLRHTAATLARYSPLPIGGALAVVVLGLAAAAILLVVSVGPGILDQLEMLWQSLPRALDRVEQTLQQRSWGRFLLQRMSDGGERPRWNVLGAIGGTVSTVVGVLGNMVILLTVAIFLAIDPGLYRRGLLHPPSRPAEQAHPRRRDPRRPRRGSVAMAAGTVRRHGGWSPFRPEPASG